MVSPGGYQEGVGVSRDNKEASKWYRAAADQGEPQSQTNLGSMYAHGEGVPQSYAEAAKWFRLAANQGLAKAQLNLGMFYVNGLGVRKNKVQAYLWFELAAQRGELDGGLAQQAIATEMTQGEIALAEMLARNWKPKSERSTPADGAGAAHGSVL